MHRMVFWHPVEPEAYSRERSGLDVTAKVVRRCSLWEEMPGGCYAQRPGTP